MHMSLVQLETAKCLQFCGRQNNFNVTVSRFMSLFTLCLYLNNEGCLRAEHTSEELGGGQRGCSDICKSEMLWYLVLKSLNLYKLTAKIERFLFGKLVQIEEWVDSFLGGGVRQQNSNKKVKYISCACDLHFKLSVKENCRGLQCFCVQFLTPFVPPYSSNCWTVHRCSQDTRFALFFFFSLCWCVCFRLNFVWSIC